MVGHPGVSVVVCCHNGAAKLPTTLAHLARQRVPDEVGFEVVVVDNGSTDDTSTVAQRLWPADSPFPLRVVDEPLKGLSNARCRGFAEARYEFVSFVDDDNWVCPDWIGVVHEILLENPKVAACGGPTEGAFEVPPPEWFTSYQGNFAVGSQHEKPGDVTDRPNVLWGAGLTVRKSAWSALQQSGFRFRLTDRSGAGLTSGGDHELCFGLVLIGWRLWYDPRLHLRHYMPAGRVNWGYLRRLLRGAGWSSAWLDPYKEALGQQARQSWFWANLKLTILLARNPLRLLRSCFSLGEGRAAVAAHELLVGRLIAQLQHRKSIDRLRRELEQTPGAPFRNNNRVLLQTRSHAPF